MPEGVGGTAPVRAMIKGLGSLPHTFTQSQSEPLAVSSLSRPL